MGGVGADGEETPPPRAAAGDASFEYGAQPGQFDASLGAIESGVGPAERVNC